MLGECHAHVIMDGINYKEAVRIHKNGVVDAAICQCFQKYQNAGILFFRDGGDSYGVSKRAKELALKYGIEYLTPIFAIHKEGHYGGIVGRSFSNLKEYKKLVQEVKQSGGDFIKIMISGLIDFTQFGILTETGLEAETIKEMISIAHDEGMAVMAHCNGAKTMLAAAEAGVDSIEHGAYSDQEALEAMVQHRVVWTPTVSPIGNLTGGGRFCDEITEKIKESHLGQIRKFVQMGGNVALGSDAGAWRVSHVTGLGTELKYLTEIVDKSHLKNSELMIKKRFTRSI